MIKLFKNDNSLESKNKKAIILASMFFVLSLMLVNETSADTIYSNYYFTGSFNNTTPNWIINKSFIIPDNYYLILNSINCDVNNAYIENVTPLYLSSYDTNSIISSIRFNEFISPNIFLPWVLKNGYPDYSKSGSWWVLNFFINYYKVVNPSTSQIYWCSVNYKLTTEYPFDSSLVVIWQNNVIYDLREWLKSDDFIGTIQIIYINILNLVLVLMISYYSLKLWFYIVYYQRKWKK